MKPESDGFSFDWRLVLLMEATAWERNPLTTDRLRAAVVNTRSRFPQHAGKIDAAERELLDPKSDWRPFMKCLKELGERKTKRAAAILSHAHGKG